MCGGCSLIEYRKMLIILLLAIVIASPNAFSWTQLLNSPTHQGVLEQTSQGVCTDYNISSVFEAGLCIATNPLLIDVDGDAVLDIVFPSCDGHTYAIKGNGELIWKINYGEGLVSMAAGDLDGDGKLELVIPSGEFLVVANLSSGETINVIRGMFYKESPAISDVDNDGVSDAIETSLDGKLYVLGIDNVKYQVQVSEDPLSSPSIGNLDGDHLPEIVFSTIRKDPATLFIYSLNNGSLVQKYTVQLEGSFNGVPLLYDVDGDGFLDILMATSKYLYAISLVPSLSLIWKTEVPGTSYSAPIVLDTDGNGENEILLGTSNGVLVLSMTGLLLEYYEEIDVSYSGFVAGDVDGDGNLELVLAQYSGEIDIVDLPTDDLTLATWLALTGAPIMAPPALGDVNGDQVPDIVFGSRDFHLYLVNASCTFAQTATETTNNKTQVNTTTAPTNTETTIEKTPFSELQEPTNNRLSELYPLVLAILAVISFTIWARKH